MRLLPQARPAGVEPKSPEVQGASQQMGRVPGPVLTAARWVTGVSFPQQGRWPLEQARSDCLQEHPAPRAEISSPSLDLSGALHSPQTRTTGPKRPHKRLILPRPKEARTWLLATSPQDHLPQPEDTWAPPKL